MARYLHLAASRFERLTPDATAILCTPEWTHLGEGPINWSQEIREQFQFGQYRNGIRLWLASLYRNSRPRYNSEQLSKMYASCDFREFYFRAGDRLDFADGELSFIVSEHFFEHLFFDDAVALLRECHRVLKPGGVIRTCVPDADLRTYEPPEQPGYPSHRVPWSHHQKHRSRWSIYSLSETLRLTGLQPRGVLYCNKDAEFIRDIPVAPFSEYPLTDTHSLIGTTAYLRRLPSLVVDGIKPVHSA